MPKPQILRDYQRQGVAQIFEAWKQGARSVLAVAPTGSGKTSAFTWVTTQVAGGSRPVLINVHRRELAMQAVARLKEFGVDYGLIMSGEPTRTRALVQVASIQTLVRRTCPPADLVINDEAHLSTAETWRKILAQYPQARISGWTATPFRLSGRPLAGDYDACVVIASPAELREQGYLCNYVGFSYKTPDLSDVATVGDDYNQGQAAKLMSGSVIVGDIVEQWGKHARSLSTVVFAVTVEHSRQLCTAFKAAGVAAEHLDGSTPLEQRRGILRRVEAGTTRVLCNVGVAVEGLDIPRLKCCVLARPTKSLARAIQMMGRVRRPFEGIAARIHDHAFVIRQHGLPDAERDYHLDAKPEKPPNLTTCDTCLAVFQGRQCPSCGTENERKESARGEIQTITEAEQYAFSSSEEPTAAAEPVEPKKPVEVSWNTVGRVVEGTLLAKTDEKTDWGKRKRYLVKGAKREYAFPGTSVIDAGLTRVAIGSLIRVTYLSQTDLAGGKVRKEFRVEVDDGKPEVTPDDRRFLHRPSVMGSQHPAQGSTIATVVETTE